jgi:DNA polymerase III delta prime subunit
MNNLKKSLWVEAYRPKTISEVIFQDSRHEKFFKGIVESGELPNLLLQGIRGTGKTTISKALINDLKVDPSDVLLVKCSSEQIEVIRGKVEGFAMTFPTGKFKVVRLEEFDYLSHNSQALLRSLIEDSSQNCRFIATCNYINKVMPELRSRFQEFQFKGPDQDKVTLRMAEMLDREAVDFEPSDLVNYVAVGYPDVRKIIQLLQQNSTKNSGEGVLHKKLLPSSGAEAQEAEWKFALLDHLQKGELEKARSLVCKTATKEEYVGIYRFLYENLDRIKIKNKNQAIIIIADYLDRHGRSDDTEITLAGCFSELEEACT